MDPNEREVGPVTCLVILKFLKFPLLSDEALAALGKAASSLSMDKSWIGWDLEDLEALTQSDSQREADSDDESGSEGEVERMLPAPL